MTADDRELLHRHLNGDLRGAELEAFFARLQTSPELRRELASFATDEALLSELVLENRHRLPRRRSLRWALVPSAAAAAMLLAGLVFLLQLPSSPVAGTLLAAGPDTVVLRGGKAVPAKAGLVIRDGDEILGSAEIRTEAGAFTADSGSSFALSEKGTRLDLRRGRLRGTPPSIHTPSGTVFGNRSSLEVSYLTKHLRVAIERSAPLAYSTVFTLRGENLALTEGQYVLVGTTTETGRAVAPSKRDAAIGRAQAFLASRKTDLTRSIRDGKRHAEAPPRTYAELAALALPDDDPLAAELVQAMRGKRIESTYTAALQAVALARIDPERLRECYRFLADGQCLNGQWDYGEAPSQRRPSGDNSCSAYAALGLRACREAGIEVDRELVLRARAWWLQSQNPDGGWGYGEFGKTGAEEAARPTEAGLASYGSATASGASSVLVLSRLLGEDYSGHASVRRAVDWLAANHARDRNPRKAPGFAHLHYWLALERLGLGLGTEHVGPHEWYADGAEFLLSRQRPDGSWTVEEGAFMGREVGDVLDTCLAVLFLRRAPFSREERW